MVNHTCHPSYGADHISDSGLVFAIYMLKQYFGYAVFSCGMIFVLFFASDEVRQIIRQEVENNRTCKDKQRIRFLISDGQERLKRLDETLDMQGR